MVFIAPSPAGGVQAPGEYLVDECADSDRRGVSEVSGPGEILREEEAVRDLRPVPGPHAGAVVDASAIRQIDPPMGVDDSLPVEGEHPDEDEVIDLRPPEQ